MQIKILMPELSPSMTEATLVKWQKKEGDRIFSGDIIAEIETDKATIDFEAVDEGILSRILVAEGTEGVKVGDVIAILTVGEESTTLADSPRPVAQAGKAERSETPIVDADAHAAVADSGAGNRLVASPVARRLAEQYGLDLSKILGSGPGGRIGKEDVEAARKKSAAGVGIKEAESPPPLPFGPRFHEVSNSPSRKFMARRLSESKQQTPHFYLSIDCQVDDLLTMRVALNERSGKPKLSITDFIVRAVALALRDVPAANASWTDAATRQYDDVDISVAVATPDGLITPIIRHADRKELHQISGEISELAGRARDGKLKPEEFQGGGFTISNLGMFGVRQFAAIINPPQSCILAVGVCEPRPVVKGGHLTVGTVMTCTLSVDHRAVDGAVGAKFLQAFKVRIEEPSSLNP